MVMLVRNRLKLTQQALTSLYAETNTGSFNLTVVDDESDILTRRYLTSIREPNFSYIRTENSGHVLSQLKNLGVYWAEQRFGRGNWLYLSDNDVWFSRNWLERLKGVAQVSERYRYKLWGGQIHPYHQPLPDGGVPQLDHHDVLDGPSWLMRWDTWKMFGPLDRTTAPGVCQSEEYPFCTRLRASGHRIGVIKPHVVVHTGLTNSNGILAPGADARRKLIPEGVYSE